MRQHPHLLISMLLCCAACLMAAEQLEETWYGGTIAGSRSLSAHGLLQRQDDGGYRYTFELEALITRKLGLLGSELHLQQHRRFDENPDGLLQAFHFEDASTGSHVIATGSVHADHVTAEIIRAGERSQQRLELPPGIRLYGQHGSQRLFASMATDLQVGEELTFHSLELMTGRVLLIESRAVLKQRWPDGRLGLELHMDLLPGMPVRSVVDADGTLLSMRMRMGPISMTLQQSDGPQELQAARIDALALIGASGGMPGRDGVNRYRLPIGVQAHQGGFQSQHGRVVQVRDLARPEPLATPADWLQPAPNIETGHAELQAWVDDLLAEAKDVSVAEQAERLRVAVRSHIVHKDLSRADASAIETYRSRRGDCTEHANLLVALLRSAGIPARVEYGVVYSPSLGGWGGHAWAAAHDGSRWLLMDAAYPGIPRSHYIGLGLADKDLAACIAGLSHLLGGDIETLKD
ncbi:MAG: transglutaminase-like domain-containing protein [Planctomycetota bacterium]